MWQKQTSFWQKSVPAVIYVTYAVSVQFTYALCQGDFFIVQKNVKSGGGVYVGVEEMWQENGKYSAFELHAFIELLFLVV